MKINFKRFFLLLLTIFPFFIYADPLTVDQLNKVNLEKEGRLFLYTYPRSGTNWTRYILKFFSHRLITFNRKVGLSNENPWNIETDFKKPAIHSKHYYHYRKLERLGMAPYNFKKDKILIVVRNPVEAIVRQLFYAHEMPYEELGPYFRKNYFELYDNLKFFEKWPLSSRLLIYYEDLMTNPRNEIKKILDFIDEPTDQLEPFIQNLKVHVANSMAVYQKRHHSTGGSITHGENFRYHSEKMPPKVYRDLLMVLKLQNPILFNKYFTKKYNL